MTRTKFVGITTIVMALTAASAARADIITYDVSGTLMPSTGPAACPTTCTLGGQIVIDNSAGADNGGFVSGDVTATGFSPSVGPFTQFVSIVANSGPPNTTLTLSDDISVTLNTANGGSFFNQPPTQNLMFTATVATVPFNQVTPNTATWGGSGSIDPVPGPVLGAGLPGLIAGCGSLLAWWRAKRRAQAVA